MADPSRADLTRLLSRFLDGDRRAERSLFEMLRAHVRTTARTFLGADALEVDDVVSETLTVVMSHVRANGGFTGDLPRFAITIARNRCRNILNRRRTRPHVPIEPLAEWVAHPDRSPLDLLQEEESRRFLHEAIDRLGRVCRLILRAFYLEGRAVREIRAAVGLKTVQGVYYRRTSCLRELAGAIAERMGEFSF